MLQRPGNAPKGRDAGENANMPTQFDFRRYRRDNNDQQVLRSMTGPIQHGEQKDNSRQPSIFLETEFYEKANALRAEFDEKLLKAADINAGATPLAYVYSEKKCQFLSASAEQVFTHAILNDLIDRISTWSSKQLGTLHVSTPQIRLFLAGCKRHLLRDDIRVQWHYLLSLSLKWPRGSYFKVLPSGNRNSRFEIAQMLKSELAFNQFVVHSVEDAYGIDFSGKTMNPVHGIVLLDGYLW